MILEFHGVYGIRKLQRERNIVNLFLDDKWSAKFRMKLSGAGLVFKREVVCGKPDSVVNSELLR